MATQPAPANDTNDALIDLALESDLLGLLLSDNSHVDRTADLLAAADFSEPLYQRIFETIVHFVSQGRAANPATLRGVFADDPAIVELGGPSFLMSLTANPAAWLTAPDAAKQLADLAQRRRMRDGLQEAARQCCDANIPASEIVTLADNAVSARAQSTIRQATAAQCLGDLVDSFDVEPEGVLCQQIPALDELHGPMEPSQLVILAARPGMGKTALAISYGLGAAQAGHGVLFASLEMNSQQLAGRMAADLCFDGQSIPYAPIRDRKLNDFQRRRVAEAASRAHSLPFSIIDTGSLTPGRLAMLARRHDRRMRAKGHKLELIVVDYLQLLRADSGTNKPYEAVSEVSRCLKALAKDMDVAILALAQLSREVERRPDKRPQLSDLRDSGQIEQDADSVIFLLREEYYLRKAEPDQMHPERIAWEQAMEQAKNRIEFILAKRRNGVEGCAIGSFHGAFQAVR
jgi:replicative DNA helicase